MNSERLCMGCMRDRAEAQVCPECGYQEGTPPDSQAQLFPHTVLVEKYLLGKVLGQGGFGITYLAWDLLLNRKLAIKEYFPREICSRARDERTVQPLNQRSRQDFTYGLSRFLEEGQNLARFRDYPGIVSLLEFFEANGTAYIVMAYMEGMTFKQYLEKQGGRIGFDAAVAILTPVMDALREVHRVGMLHRDISPDNIYLNEDRQVKILDFGATRYAMREQSSGLTVLFKPGYAPLEQYSSGGKQGPWTDVYALGATFYRALTGTAPSEAPDRMAHDDLVPPSRLGVQIPQKSEQALVKALAVHWGNRFQNIQDFQGAVVVIPAPPVPDKDRPTHPNRLWMAAAGLLFATTLAFASLWYSASQQLKAERMRIPDRPDDSALVETRRQLVDTQNKLADAQKQLDAVTHEGSDVRTNLTEYARKLNAVTAQRDALQKKIDDLTQGLTTAQQLREAALKEAEAAKNEAKSANAQIEARHLKIVYFEFFSWNHKTKVRKGPMAQFQSSNTEYLLCAVGGPNPRQGSQALSGAVEVRFVDPHGSMKYNVTLPVTASTNDASWVTQAVYGNDKAGSFERGDWRVEVLSEGQRIAAKQFQVF